MNFLQVSLTSRCNLSCWHCPMANYRNTDNEAFRLTNGRLLPWLEKYVSPEEWIIEFTGGEPALYDGINELVTILSEKGYRGLVKTNGLLPIAKSSGFKRVAAFHQLDNPPKHFDEILIVDKIQRDEKVAYCKEHEWSYKVIGYNDENPDNAFHGFNLCAFVDPHGHPTSCKAAPVMYEEWPDKYALEFTGLKTTACCCHCKAAVDAWRFMEDEWKV